MDVPKFPNGSIRLDDGLLSILGGDPLVIPVADIVGAEWRPARKKGLLAFELSYRQGLDAARTKLLVAADHQAALERLVAEIT